MFKKFSDVSKEEVAENEHFRAHALQVTESVSLAVSSLDDMDSLVLILKDLGSAHSSQNLQNAHFDVSHLAQSSWLTLSGDSKRERERERERDSDGLRE